MYTHLSRLPNTLLICTNSITSIHTKTNTITKHVHICSLRQIYDYLNPASGFIWPSHRSQLTTSEMDSCCWEPEFPAITEPSHPFTCRSMGQLLKWPLEQCFIHWCFNPLHRALAPLSRPISVLPRPPYLTSAVCLGDGLWDKTVTRTTESY